MEGKSSKGLKIYKVKDLEDKGKYPEVNPILPQPPFLMIGYGSVRCVYEYSNVETKEGVKYIKNVKIGDYVKGDEGFVEVVAVLKQGTQKCYRIILHNDMEIILTDNHQIQTKQGLKRLRNITDEDITTEQGHFKIKSKEEYGEVMTYDLSVKSNNNLFYCNEILVHNSGKTNSLINMMRREDMYGTDYWDDVLVISNTAGNDPKMYKFMGDAFRLEDHYENKMIDDLVAKQKSYDREDMPTQLLILDDIISRDFKKSSSNAINSLATRFRHYEMSIMVFVQSARAVSNMIRSNSTDILVYHQQSTLEWEKIKLEYSDLAPKNFENYYKISQMERYNFLYIDAQQNPAHFYSGFSELIGIGDKMLYKGKIPGDEDEVFE